MTRAYLLDKYGVRLSMEQVAEELGMSIGTVYNLISSGELGIPTYKEGNRRYASYQGIADYLDDKHEEAKKKLHKEKVT
jgi:excisionase family DNA binding protein